MTSRPVVVVYDVVDDHRRAQLRAALAPVADRFQQSGWLVPAAARLTPARLAVGLGGLLAPQDRLRVLAPCSDCARRTWWLPHGQPFDLGRRSLYVVW